MKRLTALALFVAGVVSPLCAQRGMSRGGFSGHTSFHEGFGTPHPYSFAGAARYPSNRSFRAAPGLWRGGPANYGGRPGYSWNRQYGRPYPFPYGVGIYYGAPWGTGWIGPDFSGYNTDTGGGYDNSAMPPEYAAGGYADGPEEPPPPPPVPRAPYRRTPSEQPQTSAPPANENAVTLIFKDGRPPEQIHNYAMTATTLYILDAHSRNIPIDQLNLAATEKANFDAGVNFRPLRRAE